MARGVLRHTRSSEHTTTCVTRTMMAQDDTHSKVLTNFEDRLDFWQYRAHLWYHYTGVGYLLRLQCAYQNICAGKFLLAQIVFVRLDV